MRRPGDVFVGALAAVLLASAAQATPFSAADSFIPACGGLLADPPPGGWKSWSSSATWNGAAVPGVGAQAWVNVTIPCGVGVLLDVPLAQVLVLNVLGALKFKDDPSLPQINLTAAFVVVEGRLTIGTQASQYSQRAIINLVPNPNKRLPFLYTSRQPADALNPRSLGHKAFAVVGGQVDLHGLPGPSSIPTWTTLGATAKQGDKFVIVRGDVSNWPIGAPIVIAPTDYYPDQEDMVTITSIASAGAGLWKVSFATALQYNHFGDPLGVPDGFGGYIEETAEVALLTRKIVVTGTDEPAPYDLEGGHFIVFMTNTQQIIEGVQFLKMGQQGVLGRYNIHFHVTGNQKDNSVIRKNLILHSKQRCIVIHATHNATVDSNVAYNTSGHCFMIEEGGETGNTFINNFGLRTRAVTKRIPLSSNPNTTEETDDSPSTFWITNPYNNYIGNRAGGSESSGFWMELRQNVRGLSLLLDSLKTIRPIYVDRVGTFVGNTAHSNLFAGYQAYPHGFLPRFNASTLSDDFWDNPVWVKMGNFNLWKNMQYGAFLHDTDHVVFANSSFADNFVGIQLTEVQGVNLTGHRIVGLSNNYGNPAYCNETWGYWTCGPIAGCKFPLATGQQGRSVGWGLANQTVFGVSIDENRPYEDGSLVNLLNDTTFSLFDNTCHPAAAVAVGGNRATFWNAGHGFQKLKFSAASITNKIWMYPRKFTDATGDLTNGGEVATMFAIRDLDGSIVGSPGYVIASSLVMSAPSLTPLPNSNALASPNACYRSVMITYFEPGFEPYPDTNFDYNKMVDGPRVLGDYSYLKIVRASDGKSMSVEGNLRQYGYAVTEGTTRFFPVTLLGGNTYDVTLVGPTGWPSFVPDNITVYYDDGPGCGQGVTLRFRGNSAVPYSWSMLEVDTDWNNIGTHPTSWFPCQGTTGITPALAPVYFRYVCSVAAQALELTLSTALAATTPITILPTSTAPPACAASSRCGLTATKTTWAYNQQGLNLYPPYAGGPAFYNPLYPTPSPAWQSGPGPLGYEGWAWPALGTYLVGPDWSSRVTYYFKTSFNVANSKCASVLYVDVAVVDGLVLYLNNVEILRTNMPAGTPDNSTVALSHLTPAMDYDYAYTSFAIPLNASSPFSLVDGPNYLAAEVHVNLQDNGWEVGFSLRASALVTAGCTGGTVRTEVCDGVDNNFDGLVDADPVSKKLLQRPCWTACGAGNQTCTNGAYQNCNAPPVLPEICNGIDDNCDGLIDNGPIPQLNCAAGQVCFAGKCQAVQALTKPAALWGPKATGWTYHMWGNDFTAYPTWKAGAKPVPAGYPAWGTGAGDFGVFPDNSLWAFTTPLVQNSGGTIYTRYFVKSFALNTTDKASTWGFVAGLRRADGAVVYLNSQELFRSNMPKGTVAYKTLASSWSAGQDPTWDTNAVLYFPFNPTRASGQLAVAGTNWLAVELHGADQWTQNWVFDLNLTRLVTVPCPTTAACIRYPPADSTFINTGDAWKFLDASAALPPANWYKAAYVDTAWASGPSPLGGGDWGGYMATTIKFGSAAGNGRTTYYFRKTLSIVDGACFYNLTLNLLANDGAVVYINGAEALRYNMPTSGNITASTPAMDWPPWEHRAFVLSAGWLKNGANLIAVELHQMPETTDNYAFDLQMWGRREAGTCTPLPA